MADKQRHAQELTPQDYLNKIKESYQITSKLDTKFFTDEQDKDSTLTVEDLTKHKRNAFYWRSCKNSKYAVVSNVTLVKVMIENCSDCTLTFHGPITTSVIEVWRCNNITLNIDTDVFTLQVDLCNNLQANYTHKRHLGSIVQAGIKGFRINFLDYPDMSFDSGYSELLKTNPGINDTTDQFITRFIEEKLLTEKVVRDQKGMHSTQRELDDGKNQSEEKTTAQLKEMLKMAGSTVGLEEAELLAKSKEGRAELEEKYKVEAQANMKKHAGNKAFSNGDFPTALKRFTEAIEITPENHLLYSNRCMTYIQLKDWENALNDANKCTELAGDFAKGHFRKGVVLTELKRKDDALAALTKARDLDPKDNEIQQAMEKANQL